jgi:hypothetical protein
MLRESKLVDELKQINQQILVPGSTPYCIYGDPAYPQSDEICAPHRGVCTPAEAAFNKDMSGARVTVEWGFAYVQQNFPYLAYKGNLKIWEGPIQNHIENAVLLTNIFTIYYGASEWIQHFGHVSNLTVDQYLA